MTNSKKIKTARILVGVFTVIIAVWAAGLFMASFMPWWIPVAIGVSVFIASYIPGEKLWKSWLGLDRRWMAGLVHLVVAGSIGAFAVIGANYYGASPSSARKVKAVVTGKYTKMRPKYSRGGRNRRIKTGEYPVYYLILQLPDSLVTHRQVSAGEYAKVKHGAVRRIGMRDGMLGYPVMRD